MMTAKGIYLDLDDSTYYYKYEKYNPPPNQFECTKIL